MNAVSLNQISATTAEYYQLFVNALSFTLAVATVDNYVTSNRSELITLALTLGFLAGLFLVIENQIATRYSAITNDNTAQLVAGPVSLISYVLRTASRVLVHFLSTTMGRWCISLTPDDLDIWDTITAIIIAISLVWLLGSSVGLIQPPIRFKTPPPEDSDKHGRPPSGVRHDRPHHR